MVIQVSPKLEAKIEELIASGEYADAGEVIDKAVELLEERERKLTRLRQHLAEGEEDELNGNLVDFTPELWEEIKESARRRARASEKPGAHVCP